MKEKFPDIKARYWWAVLYPESMVDDWENNIDTILQVPYSYCIHNKDKDGHNGDRKIHIHLILAFGNTTTYKNAMSYFRSLMPSCCYIEKCKGIRYCYDYLIHDTSDCKKKGKHLYDVSDRVNGLNFDIGQYEQRSLEEKREDAKLLKKYIFKNEIENMYDLDICLDSDPNIDDDLRDRFEDAMIGYSGYISNACKGVYLHHSSKCGSTS